MDDFNVGDVVQKKNDKHSLFMIVGVIEEKVNSKDKNVNYETMKIFPVDKISKYGLLNQSELKIHTKTGYNDHKLLLQFIKNERERRGWKDVPDFIQVAEKNIIDKLSNARSVKPLPRRLDAIRYDLISTVDEGLDAVNDLTILYKMFGDEAYLQLRELVLQRIEHIVK